MKTLEQISRRIMERSSPVVLTGLKGAARIAALSELVRAHGERMRPLDEVDIQPRVAFDKPF